MIVHCDRVTALHDRATNRPVVPDSDVLEPEFRELLGNL